MSTGLPPAHLQLWQDCKLTVQLAVSHQVLHGCRLHDILAVVADDDTLVEQVVCRFFPVSIVEHKHDRVVALLVGEQLWRLARNVPSVIRYADQIPKDAFPLVTAPLHCIPGISAVAVGTPVFPLHYSSV